VAEFFAVDAGAEDEFINEDDLPPLQLQPERGSIIKKTNITVKITRITRFSYVMRPCSLKIYLCFIDYIFWSISYQASFPVIRFPF
jgi:hypothetical protein